MKKIFFSVFFLFAITHQAFSMNLYEYANSMLFFEEVSSDIQNIMAAEKLTYNLTDKPDFFLLEKKSLPNKPVFSASVKSFLSESIQSSNIPVSYGLPVNIFKNRKEFINFTAEFPYTRREIHDVNDKGAGDIKLGADYSIQIDHLFITGSLIVKLSNGEFEETKIPFGTGSTDIGFSLNAKYFINKTELFCSFGYVNTGSYSQNQFEIKYGNEFISGFGIGYDIQRNLQAKLKLLYNNHNPNEISGELIKTKVSGLNTLDIMPCIMYQIPKFKSFINAQVIIPMHDTWNNGDEKIPKDPNRNAIFLLSLTKNF